MRTQPQALCTQYTNKRFGQFTHWVYCWKIIQQRMFVVDSSHVKIRYTYTHFFHVFKSCVSFVLPNCLNPKKIHLKIHNTALNGALTNNQVYSIQHTRYKVVWIDHCYANKILERNLQEPSSDWRHAHIKRQDKAVNSSQ